MFTPRDDGRAVEFVGRGDYGRLFVGLIGLPVPQALASPTAPNTLCEHETLYVQDIPGEIDFSTGICVVRNRHFPSLAERQAFLDTVRRRAGDGGRPRV